MTGRVHTSESIILRNLDAAVVGRLARWRAGALEVAATVELFRLLSTRGDLLGVLDDHELAFSVVQRAVPRPTSNLHLSRASAASRFHLFDRALGCLDLAVQSGAPAAEVDEVRATVLHALGDEDEALRIRSAQAAQRPSLATLGAWAVLLREVAGPFQARDLLHRALDLDASASPVESTQVAFHWGVVALRHGDLVEAEVAFQGALAGLAAHVPARGHLAEAVLLQGRAAEAAALVAPILEHTGNPEYRATYAEALVALGRLDEATAQAERARIDYERLLKRRPEAYCDHAAEFYLSVGRCPTRALALAERNLAVRSTRRSRDLVMRARVAAEQPGERLSGRRG